MKKFKSLLLVLVFSIFLFSASCAHDKVMRDYYKTVRQSELARMSAFRSYVRSNQSVKQRNIDLLRNSGSSKNNNSGMIALANAIASIEESRAVENTLKTWYGQKLPEPKSETATIIDSLSWLSAPASIVAGGWALGYVLNRSGNGGNITNSNSNNQSESNNQLNGSHRGLSFNPNDNSTVSNINLSHQPEFSPYSPGSSDSIFGQFSPGTSSSTSFTPVVTH